MATSSITHNFVISTPNSVKHFIAAIDEADRDRTPKQTLPGRQLTNPHEILALMSKRENKLLNIKILQNLSLSFIPFSLLIQETWSLKKRNFFNIIYYCFRYFSPRKIINKIVYTLKTIPHFFESKIIFNLV